MTGDIEHS